MAFRYGALRKLTYDKAAATRSRGATNSWSPAGANHQTPRKSDSNEREGRIDVLETRCRRVMGCLCLRAGSMGR